MNRKRSGKTFLVLVLFFSSGALFSLMVEKSAVYTALWGAIYIAALVMLRGEIRAVYLLFAREKLYLLLMLLSLLSVVWTETPIIVLKHFPMLLGTTVIGALIGIRFDGREIARISLAAIGIGMILSVICIYFFPKMALDSELYEAAWRGAYVTKNVFARFMAYAFVLSITCMIMDGRANLSYFSLMVLSASLLVLSESKTGLAIVIMMCFVILFLKFDIKLSKKFLLAAGAVAFLAISEVAGNLDPLLEMSGRDASLTGRTLLWVLSIDKLIEKPLLGFGYTAFWLGWEGPSADIWGMVRWEPPHSHNGFIDVALNLGLVGLAVFCIGYFMNMYRAFKFRSTDGYPLIVFTFILLYNLTESSFIVPNNFFWIIYVAMMVYMLGHGRPSRGDNVPDQVGQ